MGSIFKLLKLNPNLVIVEELDNYLKKRNILVHHFFTNYLDKKALKHAQRAAKFCDDYLKDSARMESFFQGFLNYLQLPWTKEGEEQIIAYELMDDDFPYFISHFIKHNTVDEVS